MKRTIIRIKNRSYEESDGLTELELLNAQLELEEFRLESIVEFSQEAIISLGFDGTILSWNNAAENIFRFSAHEAISQNISIISPNNTTTEESEIIERIINNEQIQPYETLRKRKDGLEIPVSLVFSPIKNIRGEIIAISEIARDITELKKAEAEIYNNQQRLHRLIDNSFLFAGLLDPNGIIVEASGTSLSAINFKKENLVGKKIESIYCWNWSKEVQQQLGESIKRAAQGETLRYEVVIRVGDNQFSSIDFQIAPIFSKDGKVTHLMISGIDITEMVEMETKLKHVAQMTIVSEITAGIAHEIKNRLTGIQGAVDILLNRQKQNTDQEILQIIRQETARIDETVRSLLTRARPRPMRPVQASITETLRWTIQIASHQIATQHPKIKINFDFADEYLVLMHDVAQIEDAVLNLIINSIEAIGDEEGRINIRLFRLDKDYQEVVIEVSDTGAGISESDMEKLFTAFFTTKQNGTGLGLATVKRISLAHGGYCKVKSSLGRGATFSIHLPYNSPINISQKL